MGRKRLEDCRVRRPEPSEFGFEKGHKRNSRVVNSRRQRFAPGRQQEGVLLFPAHFCRECGQEYHPVWRNQDGEFQPREIDDDKAEAG